MRTFLHFIFLPIAFFLATSINGQTTFFQEDFETDGTGTRYQATGQFIDADGSSEDFFGRIENVGGVLTYRGCVDDPIDITNSFVGQSGNFFMAGEDVDDTGGCGDIDGNSFKNVLFENININGASTITCKILVANGASNNCGNSSSRWDQGEGLTVTYSIDGGAFVEGLCFAPDLECNIPGDLSNEPLHLDLNCDGDGEDGFVTNTFTEYSFVIMGSGASLDLNINISANASDEEIAFDNIRLEAVTPPLPVELAAFNAAPMDDVIALDWQTLSETENDYFSIEHSTNGRNFTEIAKVKGAGNSKTPINYKWEHQQISANMNYYRLRQVDYDGAYTYSEVKLVRWTNKVAKLVTISPNPFSTEIVINVTGTTATTPIALYNSLGSLVAQQQIPAGENNYRWHLPTSSQLPSGVYLLRIGEGKNAVTRRLVRY